MGDKNWSIFEYHRQRSGIRNYVGQAGSREVLYKELEGVGQWPNPVAHHSSDLLCHKGYFRHAQALTIRTSTILALCKWYQIMCIRNYRDWFGFFKMTYVSAVMHKISVSLMQCSVAVCEKIKWRFRLCLGLRCTVIFLYIELCIFLCLYLLVIWYRAYFICFITNLW